MEMIKILLYAAVIAVVCLAINVDELEFYEAYSILLHTKKTRKMTLVLKDTVVSQKGSA